MKKGFIVGFLSGAVLTALVIRVAEAAVRLHEEEHENTMRAQTPVPPGKIVLRNI
ncbi:hypothetical protein MK805_00825 [Shimazuella sp. AN120528]|uniref:hypothetical protein n=1 Tax=Shimazuella soli TaxID=1892854 RepID=UPI001F0EFABF|nr:hypothetical protein [Shimazuella soli]MCH5583514.1 hypothetical protein [Shimazuella soli]